MVIHGCDDYRIDKRKKTQNDKCKKAMEIVNIFQENMKNGKETRVIVKNPGYVIDGKIAILLEITIDDLSLDTIPVVKVKITEAEKGEDKMIDWDGIQNEKMLRTMIKNNLNREYHANTKPSMDYIYDLLEDAYSRGIPYDVSDMESSIIAFAAQSSHQADYCLKLIDKMKFKSDER